jgi:choline dehydrogenase-like flavoprotein
MEHLNVQFGRFVSGTGVPFNTSGVGLSPTNQTLRTLGIGNGILSLSTSSTPPESGRLAPVRKVVRQAVCEVDAVREFARKFKDFTCAGDGVISSLIEQAPDRSNNVTLSTESDAFGLKRPHLHWTLTDIDRRTVRALGFELAKTFVKYDFGRVRLNDFITNTTKEIEVWPHAHQMGTTRMSSEPKHGVVDTNCRVHSVANLYLSGSSVFPTGGGINPTLTIVMLSLRLARHLRQLHIQ